MLAVADLHVHYGSAHVLQGVSLTVGEGQIVGLLGRNGAGKSTTLKAIMGLVRPSAGAVTFEGQRLDGERPHQVAARGIAWVPEDRRVFGSLTVEENIRVAAQAVRSAVAVPAARRIDEAMVAFPDLRPRARQLATSLSGGQQQMLAIARALVTGPRLLLLDEPTEGLAPSLVQAIRTGILEARARGASILLVEQNLRLALGVGDAFFVLNRGTVVYEGGRDDLLARPDVVAEHLGVGRVKEMTSGTRADSVRGGGSSE